MIPANDLSTGRGLVVAGAFLALAGCGGPPPAPVPVPEPVAAEPPEPPLPTLEERRAAPFAVLSTGTVVPYRTAAAEQAAPMQPDVPAETQDEPTAAAGSGSGTRAEPEAPQQSDSAADARTDASATAEPSPAEQPSSEYRTHRVGSGDTLWNISRRYGVTMDAIRAANGLTDDTVRLGQLLIIPSSD